MKKQEKNIMDKKLEITTRMENETTKIEIKEQYNSIDKYLEAMNDYFNLVSKNRMDIEVYILKEYGCNDFLFFDKESRLTVSELEKEILWQYNYIKENPNG